MQLQLAVILLLTVSERVTSNPVKLDSVLIEKALRERDDVNLIEQVINEMGKIVGDNLVQLFNKVNSLSLASALLTDSRMGGKDAEIVHGERGDMAQRCPKGFQAVAGDNMCY